MCREGGREGGREGFFCGTYKIEESKGRRREGGRE